VTNVDTSDRYMGSVSAAAAGPTSWRVAVGAEEVSATWEPATAIPCRAVFVCAHGAGGHMDDRSMLATSAVLRGEGLDMVRFNFLYREKGSGRPDPMPRLLTCFRAVVSRVRDELRPELLIIGGRSMGGRAASMLAADGFPCAGLLLLAYPLHPAGQPDKLRDAHLPSITAPVLCINGTRDPLCHRDLMEAVLARVGANWTMHWLEGADHSFHVLKSSGTTDAAVMRETAQVAGAWLSTLKSGKAG
jgi:predicted alpha/beta-hydrolase family hydrolase